MKKILKNKKKLIMVLVPIIIVLIVVLIIGLTSGYKDTDYLIINNKGKLIGFKEYNLTKKKIVEYDNKGNRIDGTYDKGDLLIVLINVQLVSFISIIIVAPAAIIFQLFIVI